MKKKKLRLALILIIVTVIAAALIIFAIKKSEKSGEVNEAVQVGMIETDNAYYVVSQSDSYIKVMDKESGATAPLCNRANCSHDSNDCMAYVDNTAIAEATLTFDGENLYYVDNEADNKSKLVVMKMKPDGSSKDVFTELYEYAYGEEISIRNVKLMAVCEKLLFAYDEIDATTGLSKKSIVEKIDIKEPKNKKNIIENTGHHAENEIVTTEAGKLYYVAKRYTENLDAVYGDICCYDLEKDKNECIAENIKNISGAAVYKGNIYYHVVFDDIYRWNEKENKEEKFIALSEYEKIGTIFSDGEYLYYDNSSNAAYYDEADDSEFGLGVYDSAGNRIDRIHTMNRDELLLNVYEKEKKIIYKIKNIEKDENRYLIIKDGKTSEINMG